MGAARGRPARALVHAGGDLPVLLKPIAQADAALARGLLDAVAAQDFAATADALRGGAPVGAFPSLDLALAVFPRAGAAGAAPRCANVLFSREHPAGHVARLVPNAGPADDVLFLADERDVAGTSWLWQPGARWDGHAFTPLAGHGPVRFVAPYPASLLKLMVAVGVGLVVDAGRATWAGAVADTVEAMITVSSNEATDEMVKLLHSTGGIERLHAAFARCGLTTLKLHDTTPQGGWRNGDGAGVGHIHMTAWDTVRLLWLIDAGAPPAPWLAAGAQGTPPLLKPATRDALRAVLARQQLNEILSSTALAGVPGHVDGIPASATFAHKTGTTENYASDGGIVTAPGGVHYIVAVLTNLGSRYAPHERCATTWRLPALGAAVHRLATAT